jgi:CRISPR-associated exonuclease Cas4
MEHGRIAEDAIDRLERRRGLTEFGLAEGNRQFHVWCNSHRLALSGKLDLLIESPAGLFPVDFKASDRSVHDNHIVQLCGYALLLEDKYQRPVERGFIFLIPCEVIVAVDLTAGRKEQTRTVMERIRAAITDQATPGATEVRARCDDCEYRNYCGDVF